MLIRTGIPPKGKLNETDIDGKLFVKNPYRWDTCWKDSLDVAGLKSFFRRKLYYCRKVPYLEFILERIIRMELC